MMDIHVLMKQTYEYYYKHNSEAQMNIGRYMRVYLLHHTYERVRLKITQYTGTCTTHTHTQTHVHIL